jgi:outer membrane receptor protein involved in Fe transport
LQTGYIVWITSLERSPALSDGSSSFTVHDWRRASAIFQRPTAFRPVGQINGPQCRAAALSRCALAALLLSSAAFADPDRPGSGQQKTSPAPKNAAGEQIVVTGRTHIYSRQLDRSTYVVGRDLQGANGSIADVLRNIPSVDVDLQGNVSLRGQSNVTILVDGKPTSLFRGAGGGQVLQDIPASQFEKVEVMTNPSAAFGSEGTGGIINLISRRNRTAALAGSIRGNLGTSGRRGTAGSVSKKFGGLSLSADGSFRRDPQFSTDVVRFTELDGGGAPILHTHEVTNGVGNLHLWTARFGADYDVDAKTRLSAEFHHTSFDYHSHMVSTLVGTDHAGAISILFDRTGLLVMNRADSEGSLTYRHDFAGTDHNLIASLTVERTHEHNDRVFDDENLLPALPPQFENVTGRNHLHRTELKADYSRPLAGSGNLQAGYDVEINRDLLRDRAGFGPNVAIAAMPQPAFSDLFHFHQTVAAAYVTLEQSFGAITAQLGLRAEAATTKVESEASDFTRKTSELRLFPSLHGEYSLGKKDLIRASFAKRIARPEATDLDPFRRFVDPFHFEAGNPTLGPQLTSSFEFGFEHHKGNVLASATLYYRHNKRGVTDVTTEIADRVLLTTQENLKSNDSLGVELVANGKVTKTLAYRLSGNIFHYRIDASNLGFASRSAWIESGKAGLDWQPDPMDLAQATFSLTGKKLFPQGRRDPMLLVNLGYRHKLNARLWGFITAQDALHTYKQHSFVRTPTSIERSDDSARTRAAFIGLTYNFGKVTRDPAFDYNG